MSETRVKTACGTCGKVVAARLLPGTDLITGIEKACADNGIKHAYATCFGSFKAAGFMILVPKSDAKVGAGYGDMVHRDGPVEFLHGCGVVCQTKGDYDTHFHATMCDQYGTAFGGHIVKGKNHALTTVDLMLFEVQGVTMTREYEEETDLVQFNPKK